MAQIQTLFLWIISVAKVVVWTWTMVVVFLTIWLRQLRRPGKRDGGRPLPRRVVKCPALCNTLSSDWSGSALRGSP